MDGPEAAGGPCISSQQLIHSYNFERFILHSEAVEVCILNLSVLIPPQNTHESCNQVQVPKLGIRRDSRLGEYHGAEDGHMSKAKQTC